MERFEKTRKLEGEPFCDKGNILRAYWSCCKLSYFSTTPLPWKSFPPPSLRATSPASGVRNWHEKLQRNHPWERFFKSICDGFTRWAKLTAGMFLHNQSPRHHKPDDPVLRLRVWRPASILRIALAGPQSFLLLKTRSCHHQLKEVPRDWLG